MNVGQVKIVGIAAVAIVLFAGVVGYFNLESAKVEAQRASEVRQIEAVQAAEVRQIEREEAAIIQAQKTERTEERSQFWQKVVPWGNDESEENNNAAVQGS